ncbi:hypothetical protein [Nocardia sp. NBC_01327]|uniref:hypothetical protein n=1 Tax=Nocardia sp. NBC_01327 TaxID=2903593 RepID=UPI002E144388|nr:hypothetical protein OG326_24200 [Nocardia sp. NBC_01327]
MTGRIVGYAVAQYQGSLFPPNIDDVHLTREGAEADVVALSFAQECVDYRIYEVREVPDAR